MKNSISGKKGLEIPKGLAPLAEFSDKDLKEQIKSFKSYELKKYADTKDLTEKRETQNFSIKWNFAKFTTSSTAPKNKNLVSKDNISKPDKLPSDHHLPEKMNNSETQASLDHKANRLSLQDINFKENDKYRKEKSNIPSIVIKTIESKQETNYHAFLSVQHSPTASILLSPSSCKDSKTDISALLRLSLEKHLRKNNLSVSNASSIKDTELFPSNLLSKLEEKKRIIEKSEDLISKYSKGKKADNEKSYYTRGSGYPSIAPTPECSSLVHIEEQPKLENSLVATSQAKLESILHTDKTYYLHQEKTSLDNSPQAALLRSKGYVEGNILHIVPDQVEGDITEGFEENDPVIHEDIQIEVEAQKAEIAKESETQQTDNVSVESTRLETNQVAHTRETNFETLKTGFSTIASEILDREIEPYSIKSFEDLETCHEKEQNIAVQKCELQVLQEDFAFEKTIRENCEKKRFSIQYKELDEKLNLDTFQVSSEEPIRKNQEYHFSEFLISAGQTDNMKQSNDTLQESDPEAQEKKTPTLVTDQQIGIVQVSLGDNEVYKTLSNIYPQGLEDILTQEIKEKSQTDLNASIKEQAQGCQDEAKKLNLSEPPILNQEGQQKRDKTSKSRRQKEKAAISQVFTFENSLGSESEKVDELAGYRKRSSSHDFTGDNHLLFGKNSESQSKASRVTQSDLESNLRTSSFKPTSIDIYTSNKYAEENSTREEVVCSLSSLNNESTKKSICRLLTTKLTPLRIALDPLCTPGKSKDLNGKVSGLRTASNQDLSDKLSQLDSLCSECDSQVGSREEHYFLFDDHFDFETQLPESDSSVPVQEDFTKDLGQTLAETPSLMLRPNDLARKDSSHDNFFAIFSENVSRVETFKKFGHHEAAIRLLEEILEEFEMEDIEDEEIINKTDNVKASENPKDMINLKYYKIQLYNMLSKELYENGRYEESLTYAKKALKLDRYNLQALYKSYQANAKLKNDEEARSILKRVRKLTQLQSFSQSQQNLNLKLDNISIPSQFSSLTNGSFCEGLQSMSLHSKLQGAVSKIWSKFKLNQLSNKIDESST